MHGDSVARPMVLKTLSERRIYMSAKPHDKQNRSKQHETKQPKSTPRTGQSESQQKRMREKDAAVRHADKAAQEDQDADRPARTAGQNRAVDQKRNAEQQYHAGGVAHDPHNRTQERVDSGYPAAGDIDVETRSGDAPYNKTYGHHE
jgi:hypothetical protein